MPNSTLSYNEYFLFIYLTMANVDNELSLTEIEVLFDKIDLEHFNNESQNELLIGVIFKKYKSMLPSERIEAIRNSAAKHLAEKQSGLKLVQNLYQIMKSDGVIKTSEEEFLKEIEKIVNEVK
jgi:hypothetical protein